MAAWVASGSWNALMSAPAIKMPGMALRNTTARTLASCSSAATASSISRKKAASNALTGGSLSWTAATAPSRWTSTKDMPATSMSAQYVGLTPRAPVNRREKRVRCAGSTGALPRWGCSPPRASLLRRVPRPGHRPLEHGHDGALVPLEDKVPHFRPGQGVRQLQEGRIGLVACAHGHHVDVRRLGALDDQGVPEGHQTRLQRVVGIDHGRGRGGQGPGQEGRLQRPEADIAGVVYDVKHGGGDAGALRQADEARLLQEQERPAAVGGVVGNGDGGALGQVLQAVHPL